MVADFTEWFLCEGWLAREWLDEELFRRLCVPSLAGLVGISPFWETYARRVGRPILLVPAMADDEFADLKPGGGDGFNVVYVGVFFRRDLPETMLDGVQLAIERGVEFKFNILGRPGLFPESVKSLRRIEADPLLRKRVQIHGWVPREQLRRIYSGAGSFLLLRQDDWRSLASFPTRLPEFLSSGVPVITSTSKNVDPYLKHRENAWLLPAGHAPQELADAISYLAVHQDQVTRIGRAGREVARTKFSFMAHGERLKEFLDRL
jgi:glycosyltransferase involved in cell wall biosynthesis